MSKVYVKFPKAGLGNLLLVWARASVFAKINGLPLITGRWWGIQPGPWIRRESKKRLYYGYFKESSLLERLIISIQKCSGTVVHELDVKQLTQPLKQNILYQFDEIVTVGNLFDSINDHAEFIKAQLYLMLNPALKTMLNKSTIPFISVHIRRGDFKFANPLTPESYFIESIQQVRNALGYDCPVTIFTDAEMHEIEEVLALPAVMLTENKPDILDILLMSKSAVIIMSRSSTFSYWSAFLSEAVVVLSAEDWQDHVKKEASSKNYIEVRWKQQDEVSKTKLQQAVQHLKPVND